MPYVWAYIVGSLLIAISVTFPLFLIARERNLAATDQPNPKALDVIGLTAFAALVASQAILTAKG